MKEGFVKNVEKMSLYSLCLFLLSFPQSVSVSQIFAGLVIATTYPLLYFKKEYRENWKKIGNYFLIFFGIYLLSFFSSLIQAESYQPFFKKFIKQSEFGDFWMLLVFPASFWIASQEKNRNVLRNFLYTSVAIVVILGIVSLFSEVRIGKFIANGFRYAPGDRLQHFSGKLGPIKLYLPIGMMNTHLTYGGLLGLILPGFLLDWFRNWKEKKNLWFYAKTTLLLCGWIVLFFNQSRSIWLGIFVLLVISLLNGTFSLRKNFPVFSKKTRWVSAFLLFFLLISTAYLFRNNWLIQRSISQIFEVHNTENQRYYIYKNTIPLLQKNALIGVGGGNYKDSHWKESTRMIEAQEQLWYELYITPRGHAHNDLLHFVAVGGIFAGILFLWFWWKLFEIFFRIDSNRTESISILTIGVLSLYPAGFFQCYLLDDEVVLPFFVFCGIFLGGFADSSRQTEGISEEDPKNTEHSEEKPDSFPKLEQRGILKRIQEREPFRFKILGALGIPLFLYWLFWIPRLSLKPLEVYNRRVRADDLNLVKTVQKNILKFETSHVESENSASTLTTSEASLSFQVEGCLTHRFPNPPIPRTVPYSFTVLIAENAVNAPKKAKITIVSRDSFDQDQLYWAQGETDLGEIEVTLKPGKNEILIPNFLLNTFPKEFPEEVFFRDFRISFLEFEKEGRVDFPKLYFGRICDTVFPQTR
ncbi:O-antigen ligase family protein [Leptospira sp. 201903070]|uniref:O-antigen ligase family protein n=1 Tax=Leptospira ainlahdjerensis TaxID=2810033 RepID=A0ABS2UED8_9LEPT|nr:O-antigen ligase family protein [Leptospira ainlahdjerensis]MBM9578736.1 O-antigen ligase family protein [Leptospira ainlahdjerensis]